MHTSVIVPTYQRRDLVVAAVNALASQSFSEAYEIVVVVDGSTDGTAEALRKIRAGVPIRILEQENQGLSAARNAGASAASGDILLFLDDDMEADSRLLAEHASAHRNGPALVMGHIPLHPDSPRNFLSDAVAEWAEERRKHLVEPGATPGLHDWLMGQASIPRSEFFRLGGFDTNFTRFGSYGNEDFDFCYRVSRAGIPILFNERALSAQRYVVDAQKHLDQWRDAGAADVNLARKYPELLNATFSSKQYPPGWLLVLYRPLRRLSLALISAGASGRFVRGLFFLVRGLARELGVRSAGGIPDSMSLQILCYHALSDLSGTVLSSYGIAPDEIHQQLDALRQANYQFVTPAEFLRFIHRKGGLPRRALLLTFDDCYQDLVREGLPVLQSLEVPAVAFAVSARLGETNVWDEHLGAPALRLCDGSDLRTLEAGGVGIAPHSRTHCFLTAASARNLRDEVVHSVSDLRKQGISPLPLFAYPHGENDQRVRNLVQVSGYKAALTTVPGMAHLHSNPYGLPRYEVMAGDSPFRLRIRLFIDRMRTYPARSVFRAKAGRARVSVIVPAYNAADTLQETLASIQNQTFQDWESVIVDDGSTDATAQIAEDWCNRDARFRLVRQQNSGEGASRNTGIRESTCEWLVFVDADDWIAPEYLERMFAATQVRQTPDGVVCGCSRVLPDGQLMKPAIYRPNDFEDPFPAFAQDCPLAIHNCMIHRAVVETAGVFDEKLETCADWDFWQRVARCGARLHTIPDVLALYRMRKGSASTKAAAVLRDGFQVIERGYKSDDRALNAGPYQNGLVSHSRPQALFRHALWPASMVVAAGDDHTWLLESLGEIEGLSTDPDSIAKELFDNVPIAAGEAPEEWPKLYDRLLPKLVELLRDLENLFDEIPDLAEAALRSLEQRIIEIAEFEDEILIGHSLGIRVDSGSPLPALVSEESVKKIVLVLTHAGEFVGSLSLDRDQAALPPEALTDRLLESLAWPLVRGYLGLVPPDDILLEAPPISADSSRLFLWLCRSMIPILRWQRSAGILRNRAVFKGSFRLISELAPLRLARELYRCEPPERSGLLRAALDRAALRALGARLPVVEFR